MRKVWLLISALLFGMGAFCFSGIDVPHFKSARAQLPLTGAGAGAPQTNIFHPTDAGANLWMWYDASVSASLTLSGSNVTAWADQSSNSNNAGVGGGSPTYSSTGWDGSSQAAVSVSAGPYVVFGSVSGNQNASWTILLCSQGSLATGSNSQRIASIFDNSNDDDVDSTYLAFVAGDTGGLWYAYNNTPGTIPSGGASYDTNKTVLGWTFDGGGAGIQAYRNGSAVGSPVSASGVTPLGGSGFVKWAFGNGGVGLSSPWSGKYAEIVILKGQVLTSTQMQGIYNYFKAKWAGLP